MSPRLSSAMQALSTASGSRFLRFLLVGAFNTGFSFAVYSTFVFLGYDFKIASLISIFFGILVSFYMHGTLVFGGVTLYALVRFVLVWVVIYGAQIAFIGVVSRFGIGSYMGGFLSIPGIALLSYILQRRFVFRAQ